MRRVRATGAIAFTRTPIRSSSRAITIVIAAMEDHHRQRMWRAMGRADIPADPRFATTAARLEKDLAALGLV